MKKYVIMFVLSLFLMGCATNSFIRQYKEVEKLHRDNKITDSEYIKTRQEILKMETGYYQNVQKARAEAQAKQPAYNIFSAPQQRQQTTFEPELSGYQYKNQPVFKKKEYIIDNSGRRIGEIEQR